MLVSYFCQSPLIKGQEYFDNDKWGVNLEASALLVQSCALLVSHKGFINFFEIVQC
jgi:hypothetical protein